MTDKREYIDLAVASIKAFADDGTLDRGELERLLALAMRDGEIDADERRVLENILRRAQQSRLTPDARAAIADVAAKHQLTLT